MKTQLKVLSILAAALAVVFFSASISQAFNAPDEMSYCRMVDNGLSFECDPVSNLVVVNNSVIPVTGLGFSSFTTSLRSINDLGFDRDVLSLSDFALANPPAPTTSLRAVNEVALFAPDLSLSDFAISAADLNNFSLSDAALALEAKDSMMMTSPVVYYFGAR